MASREHQRRGAGPGRRGARPRLLQAGLLAAAAVALAGAVDGGAPARGAQATGAGLGFELGHTSISPRHALFDGRRVRLRYRFSANRRTDLRVSVIEVRKRRTVAAWRVRRARPGQRLKRGWNGLDRRGWAVRDGRYEFRVGPRGRHDRFAGTFKLHTHVFPVEGPHGDRGPVGDFGAPRSGGRTHEGFDILADCGTPLVAARGGRVRKVGYDDRLYGWYVLINGRKTDERYFYAHLISRPSVDRGQRVHTGRRLGRVGQTGNARSTPCHLHFELRRGRRPVDPEPELRRWDRWS